MTVSIDYIVHSANREKVTVMTEFRGHDVEAQIDGLTVELLDAGEGNHGHTFRLVPLDADDMKAQSDMFTVGKRVRATFATVDAAPSTDAS